jgi:hypothetical protein
MPNRALSPITDIDFEGIKTNLRNYLSGTLEFTDYDFEGSGMNILLDVLAYNTHYMAMYANMLAAESFIDSAVLRRSVVSLAKNLGYVPTSDTAARAVVNLSFSENVVGYNTIPVGTRFTSTKDGIQYSFVTLKSYDIDKTSTPHKCENVEIHQGTFDSVSVVYDPDSNSRKMELPFDNIDRSTIRLYVMRSPTDLSNADLSWKRDGDFVSLDPTSKVFFVNENYKGNTEISFGDGILGAEPEKGSYIVAVFMKTQGPQGNNISEFLFGGLGGNQFGATVTTISPSTFGGVKDDTERIRYTAPRYYQSQDRAVTAMDYESIVLKEYNNALQVKVWGGEESDPPQYGKVFISVIPKNSQFIGELDKKTILNTILDQRKIVAVTAEVVDVDYTYILFDCSATYDSSRTLTTESGVRQSIELAASLYSAQNLYSFGGSFRYSTISRLIDLSNNAMVSNRITTRLAKRFIPTFGLSNYDLDFGAELQRSQGTCVSVISSSLFKHRNSQNVVVDCYLSDDGAGNIVLNSVKGSTVRVVNDRIGKIDYATGKMSLTGFAPTGTGTKPFIQINAVPDQTKDIVPKRNQVLFIDPSLDGGLIVRLTDSSSRRA